jgi:uncharacterized radical SAM superfamily protein
VLIEQDIIVVGIDGGGSLEERFTKLLTEARKTSWSNFGRSIAFYAPSFTKYDNKYFQAPATCFPSISITGTACALQCKHCNGRVLGTMISATTPQELLSVCRDIKKQGGTGCLISGGCLPDGSVPLHRYFETLQQIKQELELTIIVHTGIIDTPTATQLSETGIDAALIDIIGAQATIEEIYNLDVTIDDYRESLKALNAAKLPFIPHIIVGLHYGQLLGELDALNMIAEYEPSGIVVIALIPLPRTPLEKVNPPPAKDIGWVIANTRLILPNTPIALGCMRPKGTHRVQTDVLAIQAGVNAIAYPVIEAIEQAKTYDLEMRFSPQCCSQIYDDFRKFSNTRI